MKSFGLKSAGIVCILVTIVTATGALGIGSAGAARSSTHGVVGHAGTKAVTVQMTSIAGRRGRVTVQDVSGTVLGTCSGPWKKKTATCVVKVPVSATAVFVAQPLKGAGFQGWTAACGRVPGPVCALFISSKTKVIAQFGRPSSKASAVPTLNAVEGDTSGCSGYLDSETVNGTGFKANTAVSLKDDGHTVAAGTTTNTGSAKLSYTTSSEPGIYRKLVMTAGSTTAKTDIYNAGSVCSYWNGIGTGTVSFKVVGSDFDAASTVTVRFGASTAVPATADATGAFTVTTPQYACTAGTTMSLDISAIRGAHTHFSRTFNYVFAVVC